MVGFVSGLPFLYQMVERQRQIEVPKVSAAAHRHAALTVGYGGCFSCIYSVRGAGGYQMFGITPMPIYDPTEGLSYLQGLHGASSTRATSSSGSRSDREEYDQTVADVEANKYTPLIRDVEFGLGEFENDIDGYNKKLEEVLYA
jgi:urea carboxylase